MLMLLLSLLASASGFVTARPHAQRASTVTYLSSAEKETLRALGVNVALKLADVRKLFKQKDEIQAILGGINDYMTGKIEDPKEMLTKQATAINTLVEARMLSSVQDEKDMGMAYAAVAARRDGAQKTESGLIFEYLERGDSDKSPDATSTVRVHYTGTLVDGSVFDSSVERGQPAEFQVGAVIKGWQEALLLMSEGDKARLTIPSELAYGDAGTGDVVPGGATLCFDVELLKIID